MRPAAAPSVTLTFDNGPDPEVTPAVLDVLRRRAIRATFFVVGARLAAPGARALAERAHAEGHWIGNHTFTHGTPLGDRTDRGHAAAEIARTDALIGDLAHPDRLFRPMGGGGRLGPHLLSIEARDHLATGAWTVVLWSAVPGDWRDADGWPDRAIAQCLDEAEPVLVLHDIAGGALRHLDSVLGRLADHGATFRQDFPAQCVPMRRGIAGPGLDAIVAAPLDPPRARPAA
ncbi:polysaccharide deacetylase family protein [Roseomonas fluvialis]|uniref:Chitooligosaccharide deacetylase n=1 Tax=Roseomonas fluvialis TaxID=1750527 RepID=A0ABM7Y288_9PROT|nr:polysaccharide deacetylase family protein [Roseomonas fluvialis]BDG71956.1 polysaccharide deacetylase [Roseomonas fluvialis]